ncbi:MAG: glycosyltransferase [bacterium]
MKKNKFKGTVYILHLEPLKERYTEQWYRWFKKELNNLGIKYKFIQGQTLTNVVETGSVLDAEGTNYWKFTQMIEVCKLFKEKKVKPGDVFFTMDLWHPSLEAIPYMATLEKTPVKIYGFLHAGSYTTEDFASPMAPWAKYFEKGWAKLCNGVFVGSKYHKNKFIKLRCGKEIGKRIYVTGNPFDSKGAIKTSKAKTIPIKKRENIIVFSHRFDMEKRPNIFMNLIEKLWEKRKDFKVIITTSREKFRPNSEKLIKQLNNSKFPFEVKENLSKAQYYQELSKAKVFVSTTIEENFGYCLLEAIIFGCAPIVPNDFAHLEILENDKKFLYNNQREALEKISKMLDEPISCKKYAKKYDLSLGKMLKHIIY